MKKLTMILIIIMNKSQGTLFFSICQKLAFNETKARIVILEDNDYCYYPHIIIITV